MSYPGEKDAVMTFQSMLIRAFVGLVPVCILLSGSVVLFLRTKTIYAFLQLLGAGCLVVVILSHILEAFHVFPWMQWGGRTEHWSLSRSWERCSWFCIVSSRIPVTCATV